MDVELLENGMEFGQRFFVFNIGKSYCEYYDIQFYLILYLGI